METLTQKTYNDEVKAFAKNCVEDAKRDGRELSEVVWEEVDGHQWVIYTFYHHQVLQLAHTDPAERFKDMGGPDLSKGWDNVVMQATFLALEGDVMEAAQELWDASEETEATAE